MIVLFSGLPGSGKTTRLITSALEKKEAGIPVSLFLNGENPELARRPHVKPGGYMGCRTEGLRLRIDHTAGTDEAAELLGKMKKGSCAVFDEAQYYDVGIVNGWIEASKNGITVLVGSPSQSQLKALNKFEKQLPSHICHEQLNITCSSCEKTATHVTYNGDYRFPIHFCEDCLKMKNDADIKQLLDDMKAGDPFPGELKTYQPFYDVAMEGWGLVRADSLSRYQILEAAIKAYAPHAPDMTRQPHNYAYLDLGCCSGFFCDAMTTEGYQATGVDVTKHFIDWATRLAEIKGQPITYIKEDARKFISQTDMTYDITSTFATIQWVMVQKGYEAGIECFRHFFRKTRHICVVEMGYTTEDIYKDKIDGLEGEIDRDWVMKLMRTEGDFETVVLVEKGSNGIWRDLFIGFRKETDINLDSNLFKISIMTKAKGIAKKVLG